MANYEDLLKRARKDIPEDSANGERFEIPKAHGHVQGNRTVVTNFAAIVDILRRDKLHLLKYLQRELATPARIDGPRLVLGRKISPALINSKIERYTIEFVLCYKCKKPDTQLKKEGEVLILKCMACGAKNKVKAKI